MKVLSESLLDIIRKTDNCVLATHINPDGDALGSLLALADILESMGKRVFRYLDQPISPLYGFLPDCDLVETDMEKLAAFIREAGDNILGISLDCGDRQRLGHNGPELLRIKPFLVIDHHKGNNGFGDLSWIDSNRSSTGEMIFDMAVAMGLTISEKAAVALFAAIVTDTGSFRYESTSAHTFDVARQLVELGVQPDQISRSIYDNFTAERLQLMQMVLATMELYHDGRIAFINVSREMLDQTGCTLEDTENFINLPRAVTTVEVAVFLKETSEGMVSVSMRAKDTCDVAEIAARFGGGGHRNAAGFRVSVVTLDEVGDRLLPVIWQELGP